MRMSNLLVALGVVGSLGLSSVASAIVAPNVKGGRTFGVKKFTAGATFELPDGIGRVTVKAPKGYQISRSLGTSGIGIKPGKGAKGSLLFRGVTPGTYYVSAPNQRLGRGQMVKVVPSRIVHILPAKQP